jgi:serine/threonine-protein kinase SRPK3
MGNVLFRRSNAERSSSERTTQQLGTPQVGKVARKDGSPSEKGVPEYLVEPAQEDSTNSLHLDEVQLVDLGECRYSCNWLTLHAVLLMRQNSLAFFASRPPKSIFTPMSLHPPELVFKHTLTKAVDIWNLGSTVRRK